jgi:predicted nucleic acid-binding protein
MVTYFLDTSALVKRYHPEDGTPALDQLFSEADANIIISRLGSVEIVSAFALKARSGAITPAKFELYRRQVHRDIRHRTIRVVRMAIRQFQLADELLRRYATNERLRTLDALQLAVAMDLRTSDVIGAFVCADDILCALAEREGLTVRNPVSSS